MLVTWKDAIATLLVILVAGICFTTVMSNHLLVFANVDIALIVYPSSLSLQIVDGV